MNPPPDDDALRWTARLKSLAGDIAQATRRALQDARDADEPERVARAAGQGAGDVTFGLDLPSEALLDAWFDARSAEGALSLLTEDRGWRHAGPGPDGRPAACAPFDHDGPRLVIDPVDGTRNLMADLRSAWTVIGLARSPRGVAPRRTDLVQGLVSEIPGLRAGVRRVLAATRGGPCEFEEHSLAGADAPTRRRLVVDDDDRPDRGYFPFFRYHPEQRAELARLEAAFFARLEREEHADLRSVWDDQYISNGGQLVLLALGTYRMLIDARALLAERAGRPSVTSKPYDIAGALVCAEAAGVVVTAADGAPLDFPLDATTPVHFAGWTNAATRARLERHWLESVRPEARS